MRSHFYASLIVLLVLIPLGYASDSKTNVVLFIADDVSWNDYGCYGNPNARTPHIDQLAMKGIRFDQAFLTASSCSPSRASIVTGRYPHNNGGAAELHLPIAANLPWFPALLREAGYYTALSGKNHMSTAASAAGQPPHNQAFDSVDGGRKPNNSGGHAYWVQVTQQRPKDQPFFFWFAAYDAHRDWDADNEWESDRYGPMHSKENVRVPSFLSDDAETRSDLASYYNEVTRFDYYIGAVVDELRKQGVLENTLILVLADNGRPFPRAKTRLHDSGMKTALIAHWPAGISQSGTCDSLVSVLDIAPTVLELAGVEIPRTMQGVSFNPLFSDPTEQVRKYAFSEHNWHDYEAHGRSVRDGKFLYIRNHRPQLPWQGPADSVRSPSHHQLQLLRDQHELTPAQADVFLTPRPTEELYLTADDPDQLINLIEDPMYAADVLRLRQLLDTWSTQTADTVPEHLSSDFFDRESGKQLPIKNNAFRGITPGEELGAEFVNAAGPR